MKTCEETRTCNICTLSLPAKTVHKNKEMGMLICDGCLSKLRKQNKLKHQRCVDCKRRKPVHARTANKKPLCVNCYAKRRRRDKSKHENCSECGHLRPVALRKPNGNPVCDPCYRKEVTKIANAIKAESHVR